MVDLSNEGDDDGLFDRMTDLFHWTSMGTLQSVGNDFINKFRHNDAVGDYHHSTLSSKVSNTKVMKNFIKEFGKKFNDELQLNGGNVNGILGVNMPQSLRPKFNSNWHKAQGYTILINDTEQTTVYQMADFQINLSTGDWTGSFFFEVTDHFGLDKSDALTYQKVHNGFAAWWLLQHVRNHIPFKTKIWIVVKLKGKINP